MLLEICEITQLNKYNSVVTFDTEDWMN